MSRAPRPVVIVSNRGPVTFRASTEGSITTVSAKRGSGGLVSGLAPLLESGDALWVAAAMSEGDRLAAQIKESPDGHTPGSETDLVLEGDDDFTDRVHLVTMSDEELSLYYDVISNETLWFVHHGLFDLVRSPSFGPDWWEAWATYEAINERFAERVALVAPENAVVLIQDYHLTLVGETLRQKRPELALVHFLHTPFAGPDNLRVLPDAVRERMLRALTAHDACGFHTDLWVRNFEQCLDLFGVDGAQSSSAKSSGLGLFASTLTSDVDNIRSMAASPECQDELDRLDESFGDRKVIVRVDRMELSKNIVRGFEAFDLLLERRPDLRGQVVFLACCYPSRENVVDYQRYRQDVEDSARRLNERWGDSDWTPVVLETDDNYPRSVAALRRYDALMVNSIRDGLNLVAKEGPSVNERSGQLILSHQAGAWDEMRHDAYGVNPFDIAATSAALEAALDLSGDERSQRAASLLRAATARTPTDWLNDQLAAVDIVLD